MFNKQHGQSGGAHDAAQDFAAAPLEESKASDSTEQVTIALTRKELVGTIAIQWGDLRLTTPVFSQRNPRGMASSR